MIILLKIEIKLLLKQERIKKKWHKTIHLFNIIQ